MTSISPAWRVPGAEWSREVRTHLRWMGRKAKADYADRRGQVFRYVHPIVGPFVYHPADYLSRRVFLYDDFERAELEFAVRQAGRGGTVLDVGANIGLYTAACATPAARARGSVIAVEPGPATFAKLTGTCRQLGLRNVTLVQAAAGPADGTAFLVCDPAGPDVHQHLADARAHSARHLIEVETRRLDDLTDAAAVTLLKIDVEGHEAQALHGARRILENGQARLIVEFSPALLRRAGASSGELWGLLARTHRCTAFVRQDGSVVPAPDGPEAAAGEENWNTFWVPAANR